MFWTNDNALQSVRFNHIVSSKTEPESFKTYKEFLQYDTQMRTI